LPPFSCPPEGLHAAASAVSKIAASCLKHMQRSRRREEAAILPRPPEAPYRCGNYG
jgi:hypothetical protein